MKAKLDIQWFIEQHKDWEKILAEKPYCLEIKRDIVYGRNLILFKYNQIDSQFSEVIVKECRGIVLDEDTNEVVVFPFTKFFNAGEFYADKIDWNTAKVTQKLDGSIVKIVKIGPNDLLIGTNGTIDAFKAPLAEQIGCKAKTWGELVLEGLAYYGLNQEMLATILEYDKTYIFELTSPYNQVVVRWHETKLNFIGVRDNKTFQEQNFEDNQLAEIFNIPKIYDFKSEADCINAANDLPDNEEGYVVRDADFHRVKIKSPRYLALHRLSGNGIMTYEHAVELVRLNEIEEVVSYFPNFKPILDEVKVRYDAIEANLTAAENALHAWIKSNGFDHEPWWIGNGGQKRKDLAKFVMSNFKIPGVGFAIVDKKTESAAAWLKDAPAKNLLKYLGYKE